MRIRENYFIKNIGTIAMAMMIVIAAIQFSPLAAPLQPFCLGLTIVAYVFAFQGLLIKGWDNISLLQKVFSVGIVVGLTLSIL